MKKHTLNYLTFAVALSFGLFFSSCGGKKAAMKTPPAGEIEVKMLCSGPEYFSGDGFFRANAVGESMDQATSMKKAWSNASAELAKAINTTIKGVIDNYVNSREMNNKEEVEERYEGLTREVINQELQGIQKICEKQTMTESKNYKTYVALQLSGNDLLQALNDRLSKEDRLKIDYDYEKFKETFNEEMEKFSQGK